MNRLPIAVEVERADDETLDSKAILEPPIFSDAGRPVGSDPVVADKCSIYVRPGRDGPDLSFLLLDFFTFAPVERSRSVLSPTKPHHSPPDKLRALRSRAFSPTSWFTRAGSTCSPRRC